MLPVDLKIAPVRPNSHRPFSIRAKYGDTSLAQAVQHHRGGVPVPILTHADDGDRRFQRIDPSCIGGPSRSVMSDLEHIDVAYLNSAAHLRRMEDLELEEGTEDSTPAPPTALASPSDEAARHLAEGDEFFKTGYVLKASESYRHALLADPESR